MHRFELGAWNRQTDGRIAAMLIAAVTLQRILKLTHAPRATQDQGRSLVSTIDCFAYDIVNITGNIRMR